LTITSKDPVTADKSGHIHIYLQGIHKSFYRRNEGLGEKIDVLQDFSLSVYRYEFLTVFGPNGCGKSTLLNIISNLITCDSGTILIGGKPPEQCKVGFVFQNFQESLFPWRTVLDNVSFPLELKGIKREICRKRAREFLDFLGIQFHESEYHSYPYSLSGGQQQLISIARALINEPDVLLLDEPFNQLDFQTRISIQDKVLDIWERKKTTVVFVSHDIEEAIILGDRTVLLSKRPAKVMEVMNNSLLRPRNHNIVQAPEFFDLKRHALEIFSEALQS
jgi:NitT/TauT family transport system ATP-binding protein